jgi:hypothetical protein
MKMRLVEEIEKQINDLFDEAGVLPFERALILADIFRERCGGRWTIIANMDGGFRVQDVSHDKQRKH